MYFIINDEFFFDKHENLGKSKQYNKRKLISEIIYNKKYLKAEKKFSTKESFQCFTYHQY